MKPQDVIKQLVGEGTGFDIQDTLAFTIYGPSKFPEAGNAEVDFERGHVNIFNKGEDEDNGIPSQTFSIKATLEPYEKSTEQEWLTSTSSPL